MSDVMPSSPETAPTTPTTPTPPVPESTPPAAPPSIVNTPPAAEPLSVDALTIPEGFELNDANASKFLDIMNNAQLSPADRANALINLQAEISRAASETGSAQLEQQVQEWHREIANDPEIGGPKLEQTIGNIGRLMDQYATPEIRKAFDETNAGNHPQVVRFLNTVALALGEAGMQPPGGPPAQTKGDLASRLFTKSVPQN